jgi:hypothetical protein
MNFPFIWNQTSESTLNLLLPTQLPPLDYSGDYIEQVLLFERTKLAQVVPYQLIQFKTVRTQLNKQLHMAQQHFQTKHNPR